MGAITFFEERLRGSDGGEPADRESKGFDVQVFEYEGFVHLEMMPAAEVGGERHVALFALSEAKEFLASFALAVARVEGLGEL